MQKNYVYLLTYAIKLHIISSEYEINHIFTEKFIIKKGVLMLLYEKKIRKLHGNVDAFLRRIGFTSSAYSVLKTKKTDVYHEGSTTWKLFKALEKEGFIKDDGKNQVTVI